MDDYYYPGSSRIFRQVEAALRDNDMESLHHSLEERNEILQDFQEDEEEDDEDVCKTDIDIMSALHQAMNLHRFEAFQLLYESLSDRTKQLHAAHTSNNECIPLLHLAVWQGKVDFVQWLVVETGCNINQIDHLFGTPLNCATIIAAEHHPLETTQILLDNGANSDIVNVDGHSALHAAIDHNNPDVVRVLLEHGATVTEPSIHRAFERTAEIITLLVQHKAAPIETFMTLLPGFLRDPYKTRAAKVAVSRVFVQQAMADVATDIHLQDLLEQEINAHPINNNSEIVSILFETQVAQPSHRFLFQAIQAGNEAVIELLVWQYGINPLMLPSGGVNGGGSGYYYYPLLAPLNAAARHPRHYLGMLKLFFRLLNQPRNDGQFTNAHGDLPIHVLCRDPHVPIPAIQLAVEWYPGTLAVPNGDGLCPVHIAAMVDANIGVIDYLLHECPEALGQLSRLA